MMSFCFSSSVCSDSIKLKPDNKSSIFGPIQQNLFLLLKTFVSEKLTPEVDKTNYAELK